MSRLHIPAGSAAEGSDPVVITPERAGWRYTGLRVLGLRSEDERTIATGSREMLVLPLSGSCVVNVDGRRFELRGRSDVFSGVSDFAYLPVGCEARISSATGGEFALPWAEAGELAGAGDAGGGGGVHGVLDTDVAGGARGAGQTRRRLEPAYGAADDVPIEVRGAGRATRQITKLATADTFPAHRLTVVEVLTPEGNWSSHPPHKHDDASVAGEAELEEIYYFRIRGENGFGVHRTYTADGEIDETVTVRDGDVFLVPKGYHGPCMAAPEYAMYYLNVLAGPDADRTLACTDDPAYAWIRESWNGVVRDPRVPLTTAVGAGGVCSDHAGADAGSRPGHEAGGTPSVKAGP